MLLRFGRTQFLTGKMLIYTNVKDLEDVLPVKKQRRPLTFGEDLDKQVQAYVTELWKAHATVNTAIVISAGEGIAKGICILYLYICAYQSADSTINSMLEVVEVNVQLIV